MGNCCSPSSELIKEYNQGFITDKINKQKYVFPKYRLQTINENYELIKLF